MLAEQNNIHAKSKQASEKLQYEVQDTLQFLQTLQ